MQEMPVVGGTVHIRTGIRPIVGSCRSWCDGLWDCDILLFRHDHDSPRKLRDFAVTIKIGYRVM